MRRSSWSRTSRSKRAHAERQRGRVRDHVGGLAGMQRADGDHGRLQRIDVARDDGLQRHHDAAGDTTGSTRWCGMRAVAAAAVKVMVRVSDEAMPGPLREAEAARRHARHVVHGEDGVAGEALEQAVFDHAQRAAPAAFFGRLEDQVQRAGEVARPGQVARRAQQHGGVAVVAAGVHHAGVAAGVGQAGGLVDGQRVHVGAQARCCAPACPRAACRPRRCRRRRASTA